MRGERIDSLGQISTNLGVGIIVNLLNIKNFIHVLSNVKEFISFLGSAGTS